MTLPENYYQPPTNEDFSRYVNRRLIPVVDHSRLDMGLLVGEDRSSLRTPTTGELSLVLSYKGKEAYVASLADHSDSLGIVQLQGATRSKGYRVSTGVDIVRLYASQIDAIATHPESSYKELYMPRVQMIEGVEVAVSNFTSARYEQLAAELGMKYSHEEQCFIKKTR